MKFSSKFNPDVAALGIRAERPASLPLSSTTSFDVLLRPLTGTEEGLVLSRSRAYAKENGVEDPKETDALYALGIMANTIALASLDPDTPANARELSFDGGASQILGDLGREQIAFLYERQQLWQEECSPTLRRMSAEELMAHAIKIAEAQDDLPFVQLAPVMRLTLVRILARQLLSSPEAKSPSGSVSGSPPETSKSSPAST